MTFAVVTNIATMILCIAVLVQAVRLMRALDTVKGGALRDVVVALDSSTNEARRVLGKLTELLRGDVADTTRTLSEGKAMIEELTVMVGIANAIAERIVDAAGASNRGLPVSAVPKSISPPAAKAIVAKEMVSKDMVSKALVTEALVTKTTKPSKPPPPTPESASKPAARRPRTSDAPPAIA
jgi:ABC-type transporter Mla subunit MlaD